MKQTLSNQRGMALLLVLVVVALLSALLTELAFSTLVDLRLAETFRDSTRAAYLAKGGVRVGLSFLQWDQKDPINSKYDHPSEYWGQGIPSYPVGDGFVSVKIEDLDGKFNVNRLVSSGNPDGIFKPRFIQLFEELDFSAKEAEQMVAVLIDWIDENHDPEENGAEDSYYQQLDPPYNSKDGPLDSFEELSLVKGFSPEVLKKLAPHVTVYAQGGETLNINTASREVLSSWGGWYNLEDIDTLLTAREERPFTKMKDLTDLIGEAKVPGGIVLVSSTFRIESWGGVNDGARSMEAIVNKSGSILYLKVN